MTVEGWKLTRRELQDAGFLCVTDRFLVEHDSTTPSSSAIPVNSELKVGETPDSA